MPLHPRPHALDNHNINISFLTIFHHTETSDEKLTDIVMPLADVFFADTAAGEASQCAGRSNQHHSFLVFAGGPRCTSLCWCFVLDKIEVVSRFFEYSELKNSQTSSSDILFLIHSKASFMTEISTLL